MLKIFRVWVSISKRKVIWCGCVCVCVHDVFSDKRSYLLRERFGVLMFVPAAYTCLLVTCEQRTAITGVSGLFCYFIRNCWNPVHTIILDLSFHMLTSLVTLEMILFDCNIVWSILRIWTVLQYLLLPVFGFYDWVFFSALTKCIV